MAQKNLNIGPNEDFLLINMDETSCYLDMSFGNTFDFIGNINIGIISSGREIYCISVI